MSRFATGKHTSLALAFLGGTAVGVAAIGLMRRIRRPRDNANEKAEAHLWKIVEFSMAAALIRSGDKLGLYKRLQELGPVTSEDLAAKTGWSERWLREFLLQAAATGFVEYQGGLFRILPEYARLLQGPEDEEKSLAGMFQLLSALVGRTDEVAKAIQTGLGVDYDYGKEDVSTAIDRKNGNFFRYSLVDSIIAPTIIPSTGERLIDVLDRGCDVADVGCGCGASTLAMAKKFPKSRFFAFESSSDSIKVLKARILEADVSNITICDVTNRTVGDGPGLTDPSSKFKFIYSHDVLHDMTDPRGLIKETKQRLAEDGCWFIVDIDCGETVEENLRRPNAATLYGFSCLLCLSMSTSTSDGEGLGTCGFPSCVAARWMKEAGFHFFEKRKVDELPGNLCYLVA